MVDSHVVALLAGIIIGFIMALSLTRPTLYGR